MAKPRIIPTGILSGTPGQRGPVGPSGGPFPSIVGVPEGEVAVTDGSGGVEFQPAALLAVSGATPSEKPVSAGTAAVGTLDVAARADHVHPSDGLFWHWGSGIDGDLVFDGTAAVVLPELVAGMGVTTITPSGGVYTINQPIAARSIIIGNGVVLAMGQGCFVRCQGTLSCPSGSAIVHVDGNAGLANGTAGAGRTSRYAPVTSAGGAGNTGAGTAGAGSLYPNDQWGVSGGGAGGAGASGAGGTGYGSNIVSRVEVGSIGRDPMTLFLGWFHGGDFSSGAAIGMLSSGTSGGGGGGDGTNKGGGGGGAAGLLIVNARKIVGNLTFRTRGGAGGSPSSGNCGGGGGGGGGITLVNTSDASGYAGPAVTPANLAPGGAGGTKTGTGVNGSAGGAGLAFFTVWK